MNNCYDDKNSDETSNKTSELLSLPLETVQGYCKTQGRTAENSGNILLC